MSTSVQCFLKTFSRL
uniref:Uncharacterized protein n=1 Tax=Anguilla anguilla TaxID=7936 RepID=A0A0E9PGU7_ANGAN